MILRKIWEQRLVKVLEWLLPGYIFLLPWQARYIFAEYSQAVPFYGDLSFYVTDGLFLLLLILWIIWVFLKDKAIACFFIDCGKRQKIWVTTVLAFIFFAGLSMFWAPHIALSFWKWLRLLQAIVFGIMLATVPVRARAIFIALIAAGFIQGLLAIQQFLNQQIGASTFWGISAQDPRDLGVSVIEFGDQRWLRAYGGLPHPNILGGFLAMAGLAASAWYFHVYIQMLALKDKWDKLSGRELRRFQSQIIASLFAFSFIITGLLFTFSRTAWLGLAVGWLCLVLVLMRFNKKEGRKLIGIAAAKLLIIGLLILAVLQFFIGPLWTQRVADQSRVGMISVDQRAELLEEGQAIVADNVIWGVGIGGYLQTLMDKYPGREIYEYQPVHNFWLLITAELGLMGLAIFVLFLALIYIWLRQLSNKEKKLDFDKQVLWAGLIAAGIMAYYEHFWWTLPIGLNLAVIWTALFLKKSVKSGLDRPIKK